MGTCTQAQPAAKQGPQPSRSARTTAAAPIAVTPHWHRLATFVQTKLAVSAPDDPFEREADRVAEHVMRMPDEGAHQTNASGETSGSLCPRCSLMRLPDSRHPTKRASDADAAMVPEQMLHDLGPGRPLDPAARAFMEPRLGHDLSQVRVHTDARAAESARAVHALAYTAPPSRAISGACRPSPYRSAL